MNYSVTFIGLLAGLVAFGLDKSGYHFAPEQVQNAIEVILAVGGAILGWIGRYRHGDITWYGKKIYRVTSTYHPISQNNDQMPY